MEYIFNDTTYISYKNLKKEIVTVILLKQYLYHISNAHQGYDLLSMQKGQIKFLIDYYIKTYKIEPDIEMLNSGYISHQVISKKNSYSEEVLDLITKIKIEEDAIAEGKH